MGTEVQLKKVIHDYILFIREKGSRKEILHNQQGIGKLGPSDSQMIPLSQDKFPLDGVLASLQ